MQVVDEPEAHQRRGCLLINSAVELAPHDPETAQIVVAYQRATERLFRRGLELAQERGELAADRDVRALARYLVSAMQGLRVMAKADPNKAALRDVVERRARRPRLTPAVPAPPCAFARLILDHSVQQQPQHTGANRWKSKRRANCGARSR